MSAPASDDRLAALEGCKVRRLAEPPSVEDLAREISRARAEGLNVLPLGEGSRLAAGTPLAGVDLALGTTKLGHILQYEPADLTVTVEAGCTLAALGDALRERGQFLPLQPARARGTVGGLIAAADEGALALGYGRVRDRLIGVKAALADGTIVKGGGRVVKNVAGYPMHRLMSGSFGTLGVVVEASFKIQPLPEARGTRVFAFVSEGDAFEAARLAQASGTEPVFVEVLGSGELRWLAVGYDGTRTRVDAHLAEIVKHLAPARPEGSRVLSAKEDEELRCALDDPALLDQLVEALTSGDVLGPGSSSADRRSRQDGNPVGDRLVTGARRRPGGSETGGRTGSAGTIGTRGDPLPRGPAASVDGREEGPGSSPAAVRSTVRVIALPALLEATVARGHIAAEAAGSSVFSDARPGLGSACVLIAAEDETRASRAVGSFLAAARESGHAVVLSAPRSVRASIDPWGPPPADFFLMKRIKDALDPDGVFTGGRFVGGL